MLNRQAAIEPDSTPSLEFRRSMGWVFKRIMNRKSVILTLLRVPAACQRPHANLQAWAVLREMRSSIKIAEDLWKTFAALPCMCAFLLMMLDEAFLPLRVQVPKKQGVYPKAELRFLMSKPHLLQSWVLWTLRMCSWSASSVSTVTWPHLV